MTSTPLTLLYIDNDEADRFAFQRMVVEQNLPWQVTYAESLAQARSLLTSAVFDVIAADYHLPDGHSTDLFDLVDTPFILMLLTGTFEEELAQCRLKRGTDDYLAKTSDLRHLEALPLAVVKTVQRKQIRDRERELTRKLQENEQEFRATFDNAASGIVRTDGQGRFAAVNDRLCKMLGYSREELQRLTVRELTHPDDRPRSDELNAQIKDGRVQMVHYEKRYLRRDGSILWVQVGLSGVRDQAGRYLYSVGTVIDISDRKAAEEQLRLKVADLKAANELLQRTDRQKDEFLAVLSHELRNPLAPIRNSLYILDRAVPGSEQARRAQATIDRQVNHMARLVSDILDVSRMARGKIVLRPERIDLRDVVGRTVEDHRSIFSVRALRAESLMPDEPVWVNGDATRLSQALGNLLQNAAKFTKEGGSVRVELRREGASALLLVGDTGVGIAPDILPRLFEPFTQADTTLARNPGGLGLGLALVKGLTELHGGQVQASSGGLGKGSEFTMRLPLAEAPVVAGQPAPPAVGPHHRRVLVIEDNIDAAESLKDALELDQHEVMLASTGPDGMEKARKSLPDVVLCDIGLPGMDGYEVARAFRADAQLHDVALVALTGYALAEDQKRARDAGFDRHLAKPTDLGTLERVLAELPERHAA
jgi:PAS domain S-box-containing protein